MVVDFKICVYLVILILFVLPVSACNLGVVLKTDHDQKLDVEVPLITGNISGEPVPIFLGIDRISTEKGDKINYVFVCRNECNISGSNDCKFVARTSDYVLEDS